MNQYKITYHLVDGTEVSTLQGAESLQQAHLLAMGALARGPVVTVDGDGYMCSFRSEDYRQVVVEVYGGNN